MALVEVDEDRVQWLLGRMERNREGKSIDSSPEIEKWLFSLEFQY